MKEVSKEEFDNAVKIIQKALQNSQVKTYFHSLAMSNVGNLSITKNSLKALEYKGGFFEDKELLILEHQEIKLESLDDVNKKQINDLLSKQDQLYKDREKNQKELEEIQNKLKELRS